VKENIPDGWRESVNGLVVPGSAKEPDVVRAEFAVKVQGFAPPEKDKFQRDGTVVLR
jgi:hypothetical protein